MIASLAEPMINIDVDPWQLPSPQARWDAELDALGGSLLQSWPWGEIKARHGWEVERIRVEENGNIGLAQLLIRRYGPVNFAYLPRGPVVEDDLETIATLFAAIDRVCAHHRVVTLVIEPDLNTPNLANAYDADFLPGPRSIQPERTVKVSLLDDDGLLAQMRRDTRANLRWTERHGTTVEHASQTERSIDRFYALLNETSSRNDFGIHPRAYYADILRIFGDDAMLAFARVDGFDAVGLITVRQGDEALYLYGCSSTEHRLRGASVLLQFEAMRWARQRGCTHYDLWGIPAIDPPADDLARGRVKPTHGTRLDGLYQFKTGFGGEIVSYPPPIERRYRPILAWVSRRSSRYRSA